MRVLGLDVGQRRIGIAVSDPLGLTAQAVSVLSRQKLESDISAICDIARRYGAEKIIVGLPLTAEGSRSAAAQRVMAFGERLSKASKLAVEWVDERFTTAQGHQALSAMNVSGSKRKQVIDRVAAQLILQHYLDAQR